MSSQHFDLYAEQHRFDYQRLKLLLIFMVLVLCMILARLFYLTAINSHFYLEQQKKRFVEKNNLLISRQTIIDRNGFLLASNHFLYTVRFETKFYHLMKKTDQENLKKILNLDHDELQKMMKKKFSTLKKKVYLSPETVFALKKIRGIDLTSDLKRYYPLDGEISQLLGFIDDHNKGLEGLEQIFNHQLSKQDTTQISHSLQLSIDARIQGVLFHALKDGYYKNKVKSMSGMIIDPYTFEVLAVASYPSYNPNVRPQYNEAYRLKAFRDLIEPGSVIKPLTAALLLQNNPEILNDVIETWPGSMTVERNLIKDVSYFGPLNLEGILMNSSNVGLAKLILKSGPLNLKEFFENFGIIQGSSSEFTHEPPGVLPMIVKSKSFNEISLAYGYGMQTTLAQIARSYALLANGGYVLPLTLLKGNLGHQEKKYLLQRDACSKVTNMLEHVVAKGTAKNAFVPGLEIAGKTGTVRRVGKQGYEKRYHSFFAGYFPAHDPKYVLVIHADDPIERYYGGAVCAPVVKNIAPYLQNLSDIPFFQLHQTS